MDGWQDRWMKWCFTTSFTICNPAFFHWQLVWVSYSGTFFDGQPVYWFQFWCDLHTWYVNQSMVEITLDTWINRWWRTHTWYVNRSMVEITLDTWIDRWWRSHLIRESIDGGEHTLDMWIDGGDHTWWYVNRWWRSHTVICEWIIGDEKPTHGKWVFALE
jgi:hypothetical protein